MSVLDRILDPFGTRRVRLQPMLECEQVSLGTEYGGYAVSPAKLNASSIVYSFGVGEDVSFDLALIERYGATVHAFDPTPKSIAWVGAQTLPEKFVFHPWGIANHDGTARFHAPKDPSHVSHTLVEAGDNGTGTIEVPVYRLQTILSKLGHTRLDVLKMDIEGAEYGVLDDVLKSGASIPQILIEFHHRRSGITLGQTQAAVTALEAANYRAFHRNKSGYEFSFARADLI